MNRTQRFTGLAAIVAFACGVAILGNSTEPVLAEAKPVPEMKLVGTAVVDDPNFYTDETATPGIYLVSYADGDGDGVREPDDEEPGGSTGGTGGTGGIGGGESFGQSNLNGPPIDPVQTVIDICNEYGATLEEDMQGFGIFVASMSETQARAMSHDYRVEFVEGDREGEAAYVQQLTSNPSEWGLDTIDQRTSTRNFTFVYQQLATTVHAYVLDSGINPSHVEFTGRVTLDARFNGPTDWDDQGHGTSVASILGGATAGVAKEVRLHSIRVLDNRYPIPKYKLWQLAKGLAWVKNNYQLPAVVNMSLGGKRVPPVPFITMGTPPLEKATKRLVKKGIVVVVSAMNGYQSAVNFVPARVESAITVGAVDSTWTRAYYPGFWGTNFGPRVDVFAPGVDVKSAYFNSLNLYTNFPGTSAAAPFVAGVACLYLSANPSATPAQVQQWIKDNATQNAVTGSFPGVYNTTTPRRFLFTNQ